MRCADKFSRLRKPATSYPIAKDIQESLMADRLLLRVTVFHIRRMYETGVLLRFVRDSRSGLSGKPYVISRTN